MLIKFRKSADNIFVKILLGLIALSFVGIGASSFLSGNRSGDIVTFSKTESIPVETFLAVKAKEIEVLQRENNINLTEEQIKALNLDNQIITSLINESMISYLAKIYDLEISDETVISFVKKIPYFKNKNGNFDLKLFKAAFHNSQRMEDEYLENLKKSLIKNSLLDIFMQSFQPPKIMINNMINYMAETKYFDIVSIDLANKKNVTSVEKPDSKELEDFYKNNESNFVLPELRSFDYITIDKDFFAKKLDLGEKETQAYYEANKNEFDNKPYSVVKEEIREILQTTKLEDLITQFSKSLEEEVASGLTLKEIAAKHGIKVSNMKPISKDVLVEDSNLNISEIADSVFEMLEGEVSYPLELSNQNKIVLGELVKITPSRKQEFEEVKDQISSILQAKAIAGENIKILEQVQKNYQEKKVNLELLKNKGIVVESNKSMTRADFGMKEQMNPELAYLIFKTEKGQITSLVKDGNKAYFAFIKDNKIDLNKAKKIKEKSLIQIQNTIKEGIMQELIGYLAEQNDVKVKM
jgi:hypothetical protein